MSYTKIKTVQAVFKAMGLAANFVPNVSEWPEHMRAHKIVEFSLQMMIMAINEKWEADWTNTDERKYWIWWRIISKEGGVSGRGLAFIVVYFDDVTSYVGPRHVFKDDARARHAAKYFLPLYEEYVLGKKEIAKKAKAKAKTK